MAEFNPDLFFKKYRKLKFVLVIFLPFFIIACIAGFDSSRDWFIIVGTISLFLLFVDIGVIFTLLTRKHYNWIIVFLSFILIAIFLKHNRMPFSGVMLTFGFGGLGATSLFSSLIFLKRYHHISFLRYVGFSSSIVLSIVSMGLLWKNMHWPFTNVMLNVGMIAFIPFLFAFVITLPNANFVNWNNSERIVFFRAIIVPMLFLYSISVMMFVFPDFWTSLMRSVLIPFNMGSVELIQKVGLQ